MDIKPELNVSIEKIVKLYEHYNISDETLKIHLEAIKYFDVTEGQLYDGSYLKLDMRLTKLLKTRLECLLIAEAAKTPFDFS
jgi:hypothetical protein